MIVAVQASELSKRYGKTLALDGCTFTLPAGRVSALVGPNGAGKTTLLHLATGLLEPSSGSISVLGDAPANNPDLLARVGFLAQDAPLYPSSGSRRYWPSAPISTGAGMTRSYGRGWIGSPFH